MDEDGPNIDFLFSSEQNINPLVKRGFSFQYDRIYVTRNSNNFFCLASKKEKENLSVRFFICFTYPLEKYQMLGIRIP